MIPSKLETYPKDSKGIELLYIIDGDNLEFCDSINMSKASGDNGYILIIPHVIKCGFFVLTKDDRMKLIEWLAVGT